MKAFLRLLGGFIFTLMGFFAWAQVGLAQETQEFTFTLPAGVGAWHSPSIASSIPFDFVALQTDSFVEHLDLEMKIKENGVEKWHQVDLHDEYGQGLEGIVTTEALYILQLRYRGTALKAPIALTTHLFPVQENQGLAHPLLDPKLLAGPAMGGNENKPLIIPRSSWGANESLRFEDRGTGSGTNPCADLMQAHPEDFQISHSREYTDPNQKPYWPEQYSAKVDLLVVHHTNTQSIGPDPAATVRNIYNYHTVTRAWGDIGYNYLIDPQGNIYEGRFGGEHNGLPVVAGHARCSNRNTIGIALIGDHQKNPVSGSTLDSLSDLLAYFSDKHNLDPLGKTLWHGQIKNTISGHRDVQATACPGVFMYDLLPNIREAAHLKLQSEYSSTFDAQDLPYNAEVLHKEKSIELNPYGTQTLQVEYKNTGTQTWGNHTWLYGVANDQAIGIPLVPDKPYVMANMDQTSVAPGETATFQLKVKAPFRSGENVMYTVPVVDNKVKISRAPFTLKMTVSEPVLTYDFVKQSLPKGKVKTGQVMRDTGGHFYSIHLKNTGNVVWQGNSMKLMASSPQGRNSTFTQSPIVASLAQAQLAPGQVGTFQFKTLIAPTGPLGEIIEQFTPVLKENETDLHWLPNKALGFQVNLIQGDSLLSANLLTAASTTSPSPSPAPDLLDALPYSPLTKDLFRVKLSYAPAVGETAKVTSEKEFYVQNLKGGSYLKMPAGAKVDLKLWKNLIYLTTSTGQRALLSGVRFTPSEGAIMEISSWERRPSWNADLNDNQFRGVLEFRNETKSRTLLTINELPLEDYLIGVAEVSNNAPTEKHNVLAILARSYALFYLDSAFRKFPGEAYDGSDDPNVFQKYLGYGLEKRSPNFVAAVNKTAGQVVTYNGKLIKTPYFNESAGRTLSAQEVWGWTDTPYLISVDDSWCKEGAGERKGHGVGLSGCGATVMAEAGWDFIKIIQYYYTGAKVGSAKE